MLKEEPYEDRRAATAQGALAQLRISGKRRRVKARGRFSIRNGGYRVAPSLRDDVHELGQLAFRYDVAERVQQHAVLILRLRGGPAAMIRWQQWPMPIDFVAKQLGITPAMARTTMRYLEGELIERAPCEIDIHGRPVRAKQVVYRGGKRVTIDKPTLWQFTQRFREKLDRLHGFKCRRRNSQLGRSSWKSTFLKSKGENSLAKRFAKNIEDNLPSCDLRTVLRLRIQAPSKPTIHHSQPSPHSLPMDVHISTPLAKPVTPNVIPAVHQGSLFPNYRPSELWVDPRTRAAQEASEIARARRTPERIGRDVQHFRQNLRRWRVE